MKGRDGERGKERPNVWRSKGYGTLPQVAPLLFTPQKVSDFICPTTELSPRMTIPGRIRLLAAIPGPHRGPLQAEKKHNFGLANPIISLITHLIGIHKPLLHI